MSPWPATRSFLVCAVQKCVCFGLFRDPLFHADPTVFPTLIKLVLFSCFVHQCAFSACSSLPLDAPFHTRDLQEYAVLTV